MMTGMFSIDPPKSLVPIVLAGGTGTRLWPLSREGYPKQFLVLQGNQSLLQQAALRLQDFGAACVGDVTSSFELQAPIVVGNEKHRFLILDQLREVDCQPAAVLLEPTGRNTAPAVTLAALQAIRAHSDAVLVVTPADQTVTDTTAFTRALQQASAAAVGGALVILGIPPNRPETGYGYIQAEASIDSGKPAPVRRFIEKPDAETAARFLVEGGYSWNGDIFVLLASTWLAALEGFRPDILAATRSAFEARREDGVFVRPDATAFSAVPDESVDYAVLQQCPGSDFEVLMVPLDAGWSDLGAWDAVWAVGQKDNAENVTHGDVLLLSEVQSGSYLGENDIVRFEVSYGRA
jgi:mannose-1-phosphate guanylyltransferase/mannose-6-phosphate isomerase